MAEAALSAEMENLEENAFSSVTASNQHASEARGYKSQFAEEAQYILDRMRETSNNNSSNNSSARITSVIQTGQPRDGPGQIKIVVLDGSTLRTDTTSSASAALLGQQSSSHSSASSGVVLPNPGAGSKRKRDEDKAVSPRPTIIVRGSSDSWVARMVTVTNQAAQSRVLSDGGGSSTDSLKCKCCVRTNSLLFNQLVVCRGCNSAWHQLCHKPEISDTAASNASGNWRCSGCVQKEERERPPKKFRIIRHGSGSQGDAEQRNLERTISIDDQRTISAGARVDWSHRTAAQKQAYLSSLGSPELVHLLMLTLREHPNLRIFPREDAVEGQAAGRPTATTHTRQYRNGIINSIRKSSTIAAKSSPQTPQNQPDHANHETSSGVGSSAANTIIGAMIDPDEEDPTGLMEDWPRPGHGLYSKLKSDWDDLGCDDDPAFSHVLSE